MRVPLMRLSFLIWQRDDARALRRKKPPSRVGDPARRKALVIARSSMPRGCELLPRRTARRAADAASTAGRVHARRGGVARLLLALHATHRGDARAGGGGH